MKKDRDLQFLASCKNEDLKTLVDILTHDNDGEVRLAERLTNTDAYFHYYPNRLNNMWQDIAGELQRFGGNTIANICRNNGVCYREILHDVCRKMQVHFNSCDRTEEVEKQLLEKVCRDAIEQMSEDELRKLAEELNITAKNPRKYMIIAALQLAIKRGGAFFSKIALYIVQTVSKMLLGHGLYISGSNIFTKALGQLGGPIGWAITAGWAVYDLSSPAYRVTIPCVIQIACIRLQQSNN